MIYCTLPKSNAYSTSKHKYLLHQNKKIKHDDYDYHIADVSQEFQLFRILSD